MLFRTRPGVKTMVLIPMSTGINLGSWGQIWLSIVKESAKVLLSKSALEPGSIIRSPDGPLRGPMVELMLKFLLAYL